jgi:hypothetical protein
MDVKAAPAKMHLVQMAEEILQQLVSDPQPVVNVTVEINAELPKRRLRERHHPRLQEQDLGVIGAEDRCS